MKQGITELGHQEDLEDESVLAFDAGFKLPAAEDTPEFTPLLLVTRECYQSTEKCFPGVVETPLLSADFMLADSKTRLNKAYGISFVHPEQRQDFVVWKGFANMCKPEMQMPGMLAPSVQGFCLSCNTCYI